MKKEINSKIETLLKSEDFGSIINDIKELRAEYSQIEQEEEEKAKKEFIEGGGKEEEFSFSRDETDKEFMDLMTRYNSKKKEWDEAREKEEKKNLETKRALIEELKKLIEEETNISAAFRGLNDIKKRWETTGKVPNSMFKELQHDFSLQQEYFYYNINIYKTLKEYDLEKNHKLKEELVKKMKALLEMDSIKEVKGQVDILIRDWDNVGPTFQDKWQKIRDEFWGAAAEVQKKMRDYYANLKENYKKNYELKQGLVEKVREINERDLDSEKSWKKATDEVISIQKEWKGIGFATKKHNQEVWDAFKGILDDFFEKKREFYKDKKEEYGTFEKRKMQLIEKAEALKDSEDWKETTEQFKKLQRDWKSVGHAGQKKEYKLWNRFNGAANHFFEAKKHYYDTLDDRMAKNLASKNEVVEKINSFKAAGDKSKDLEELKKLSIEWNNIGIISNKEKSNALKVFNTALDKQYENLGIKGKEKESTKFKTKVESYKNANNSDDLLYKEEKKIKDQIRKLESELVNYENNLGFFANSDANNPLVQAAQQKVKDSKKEIEKLRERLKMVAS